MTGTPMDAGRLRQKTRLLGELLVAQRVLTPPQLQQALAFQRARAGCRLGQAVVELGLATEMQVCEALAAQLNIPAADLSAVDVPEELLAKLPREMAVRHECIPWFVEEKDLYLIIADPTNLAAIDEVSFHTGFRVKPVVAPEADVRAGIERFYGTEDSSLSQFDNLATQVASLTVADVSVAEEEDPAQAAQSAPLVRLVNAVLTDAIRAGASDIHFEPSSRGLQLRYRVDGLLRHVITLPRPIQSKVVSRVKVAARMDIAERRRPQDGRAFIRVGAGGYDLRVSALPIAEGEKIVIRVLAQNRASVALDDLGFDGDTLAAFKDVLKRPQGAILVTGPTGSGKTSTLYAALNFVRSESINIVTVEDPVEYRLEGVNQVAVSDKAGMTFASGLRSILRQDPDVIMVGEIRDLETAQVAFQASQTGHLVLSTLHTNDAPSAITRLVHLGLPPYLVASSLLGVLAQRLVRRMCACKTQNPDGGFAPKGCEICHYSGWLGRVGVHELMLVTPSVRTALLAERSDDAVRQAALRSGMRGMFDDGLLKVRRGVTLLDELERVVPRNALDAEAAPPRPDEERPAGESGRRHVLVVDDEPALVELFKETLEAAGYEVHTARDGRSALEQLHRSRPDLVLSDVMMPGMDGLQLLRHIRSDLSLCQTPVVFVTAATGIQDELKALDLGADDYVTKPVEPARLLGRVHRALMRGRFQRAG